MLNRILRVVRRRRAGVAELAEINELILKAARRQNYDLMHLVSYIGETMDPETRKLIKDEFMDRCSRYQAVFDPADFGKHYRHRLLERIRVLENRLDKIDERCAEAGLNWEDLTRDGDIPF